MNNYNISAVFKVINKFTKPIQEFKEKMASIKEPVKNAKQSIKNFEETTSKTMSSAGSSVNGLVSKLKTLTGAISAAIGIKKLITASDTMTNIKSRLNLMNDGLQTTQELQEKIFESAQRSRGSYSDMAQMVSKLGINAKDAFSSTDQIVGFSENMNKIFKLGGASAEEQSAGMLQLTQALSSGRLQGDEFRSITENAPGLIGIIADKLGKTRAEIRQMSKDGELTSSVIVDSVMGATDKINSQFGSLPKTWADVWTDIKNTVLKASQPILDGINWLANNIDWESIRTKFNSVVKNIAGKFNNIKKFIDDHKEQIKQIIPVINKFGLSIVAVIGTIATIKKVNSIIDGVKNGIKGLKLAFGLLTSPVGLVVLAVLALAAGFIYAYKHSEKFRTTVKNAIDKIKDACIKFWNKIKPIINAIKKWIDEHKEQIETVKQVIIIVLTAIAKTVGDTIKNMINIIGDIVKYVADVVKLISDIMHGDWSAVWEDCKNIVKDAIQYIKDLWQGLKDTLSNPVKAVVDIDKKVNGDKPHFSMWTGGLSYLVPHNAKGTNNWRGGLTWINEDEKGELVNLPNGSQIIPHDLSKYIIKENAKGKSIDVTIAKLADSIIVREDADIDKISEKLANKLKIEALKII